MNWRTRTVGLGALTAVTAIGLGACSGTVGSDPSSTPSTTNTPPSPSARTISLVDLTPADARTMTSAEARRWLRKWTRQTDNNELRDAEGEWVPQVSSKCTGIDVDIKGGKPDGTVDTYSVSTPQILAFHLSLGNKYSAVTTEWSSLSDRATTGPCAGKDVWIALIPRTYPTAGKALNVCDEYGFPYGECAARYIPLDNSETTQMVLPGDPGDDGTSDSPDDAQTPKPRKTKTAQPDIPPAEDDEASEEPIYLTAPSVIGLERRDAEANLRAIGFQPFTSPDMELGATSIDTMGDCYVTQQSIRPGTEVRVNRGPGGRFLIKPSFNMRCAP